MFAAAVSAVVPALAITGGHSTGYRLDTSSVRAFRAPYVTLP